MRAISRSPSGHRCGASHQRSKLTTEQVKQIRAAYETGRMSYYRLAVTYDCGTSTVRDIVQYRTRIAG